MEKNLQTIFAGSAIAKKKAEITVEMQKYVREELVKAMNSLSCKYLLLVGLSNASALCRDKPNLVVLQLLILSSRRKNGASKPVLKHLAPFRNLTKCSRQTSRLPA